MKRDKLRNYNLELTDFTDFARTLLLTGVWFGIGWLTNRPYLAASHYYFHFVYIYLICTSLSLFVVPHLSDKEGHVEK